MLRLFGGKKPAEATGTGAASDAQADGVIGEEQHASLKDMLVCLGLPRGDVPTKLGLGARVVYHGRALQRRSKDIEEASPHKAVALLYREVDDDKQLACVQSFGQQFGKYGIRPGERKDDLSKMLMLLADLVFAETILRAAGAAVRSPEKPKKGVVSLDNLEGCLKILFALHAAEHHDARGDDVMVTCTQTLSRQRKIGGKKGERTGAMSLLLSRVPVPAETKQAIGSFHNLTAAVNEAVLKDGRSAACAREQAADADAKIAAIQAKQEATHLQLCALVARGFEALVMDPDPLGASDRPDVAVGVPPMPPGAARLREAAFEVGVGQCREPDREARVPMVEAYKTSLTALRDFIIERRTPQIAQEIDPQRGAEAAQWLANDREGRLGPELARVMAVAMARAKAEASFHVDSVRIAILETYPKRAPEALTVALNVLTKKLRETHEPALRAEFRKHVPEFFARICPEASYDLVADLALILTILGPNALYDVSRSIYKGLHLIQSVKAIAGGPVTELVYALADEGGDRCGDSVYRGVFAALHQFQQSCLRDAEKNTAGDPKWVVKWVGFGLNIARRLVAMEALQAQLVGSEETASRAALDANEARADNARQWQRAQQAQEALAQARSRGGKSDADRSEIETLQGRVQELQAGVQESTSRADQAERRATGAAQAATAAAQQVEEAVLAVLHATRPVHYAGADRANASLNNLSPDDFDRLAQLMAAHLTHQAAAIV